MDTPNISLEPVTSSLIKSLGYDQGTNTLAVEFNRGGAVYHYAGVSQEQYDALRGAESVGKHFIANVRDAFQGVRQDEQEPKEGGGE